MKQTFDRRFMGLFACIAAANCGYFLQAFSASLPLAMMANRVSYLGSAYAILAMLLIIMDTCSIKRSAAVSAILFGVSTAAFLLAASGDWLGLYYKAVALEHLDRGPEEHPVVAEVYRVSGCGGDAQSDRVGR